MIDGVGAGFKPPAFNPTHAKDLLRDAIALPVDDRAEIAEELLASIDGTRSPRLFVRVAATDE
jgi:hypothetical protein